MGLFYLPQKRQPPVSPNRHQTERRTTANMAEEVSFNTTIFDNVQGPEVMNHFYESLGWQPGIPINPHKVRINPEDHAKIILKLAEINDKRKRLEALLLWLYCGPAPNNKVPSGKLRLFSGYLAVRPTDIQQIASQA